MHNYQSNKKLEDMSLEELWQLFPIELEIHNHSWKDFFSIEENMLNTLLKNYNDFRISHVGSTSVTGILAKSIIDILLEVNNNVSLDILRSLFEENGYQTMSVNAKRISMNKGYTIDGFSERVFHLHIRYFGDNDELYFRDILRDNPLVANKYQNLKVELARKYKYDRDRYTESKTKFVEKYTRIAILLYKDKYNK